MPLNVIPFLPNSPHRDDGLSDRSGEQWKDFPGLEGYYLISNYGRIKRLQRTFINSAGHPFTVTEKIILAQVNKDRNMMCKDWSFRLQATLQVENVSGHYQVNRIVYYMFVAPFDLADKNLVVVTKDGNAFNVKPENLQLLTYSERNKRQYTTGRQHEELRSNKLRHCRMIAASNDKCRVEVSMYTANGELVKTFPSIKKAAEGTGIKRDQITYAINHPLYKITNCYWRRSAASKINFDEINRIVKRKRIEFREKRGKKITQYSLSGIELRTYAAISEAARIVGIAHKAIALVARGKLSSAGGYIWKFKEPFTLLFLSWT